MSQPNRFKTSGAPQALALLLLLILTPAAALAFTDTDCRGLKLQDASGIPGSTTHTYSFSGTCEYFEVSEYDRHFTIAILPATAKVVWNGAKHDLTEEFWIVGSVLVRGKTVKGEVYSRFICGEDPLIVSTTCTGQEHFNQTGITYLSNPYSRDRRPITKGKTNASEAAAFSAKHVEPAPKPAAPQIPTEAIIAKGIVDSLKNAPPRVEMLRPKNEEIVTEDTLAVELRMVASHVHDYGVSNLLLDWEQLPASGQQRAPQSLPAQSLPSVKWTGQEGFYMVARVQIPRALFSGGPKWRVRARAASTKVAPSAWAEFSLVELGPQLRGVSRRGGNSR